MILFFSGFLWSYCLLPLVEDFLMSQVDVSSRVLGGIESRERITGGEREKRLTHVYVCSSQWLPVALDATTQLSQVQKTTSRLDPRRPGPGFSCKFHTICLGFFLIPRRNFYLLQLLRQEPMTIIALFACLMRG